MLKKLMLFSVVMLTVNGSLWAANAHSHDAELETVRARRADVRAAYVTNAGVDQALGRRQQRLQHRLDLLGDILGVMNDQEAVNGRYRYDRTLDSEADALRAEVDRAEVELEFGVDAE